MNPLIQIHTKRPPDFRIGGAENPYLERWWLTEREPSDTKAYLHHIMQDDIDRALHDHPSNSISIILEGGYIEHLVGGVGIPRYPGDVISRKATDAHRLELFRDINNKPIPCWTIFIFGPKLREWGFHCPNGWVHWKDFTDPLDSGKVGRGCE